MRLWPYGLAAIVTALTGAALAVALGVLLPWPVNVYAAALGVVGVLASGTAALGAITYAQSMREPPARASPPVSA